MFTHIQLGARDLPRLAAFYDHVLEPLGLIRLPSERDGGPPDAIWHYPGRHWPLFVIQYPFNGLPATWGNGVQISFMSPCRERVDEVWHRVMTCGGVSEGPPGVRDCYGPDFYAAYCRDIEGNKLCFVHDSTMSTMVSRHE